MKLKVTSLLSISLGKDEVFRNLSKEPRFSSKNIAVDKSSFVQRRSDTLKMVDKVDNPIKLIAPIKTKGDNSPG